MSKNIALCFIFMLIITFCSCTCFAETASVESISGRSLPGHIAVAKGAVYVTVEKEGYFSNKYTIYRISSDAKATYVKTLRGFYSLPIACNDQLLICKYDSDFFTHYISAFTWHLIRSNGAVERFDNHIEKDPEKRIFYSFTASAQYKTVRDADEFRLYHRNDETDAWKETGVVSNDEASVFQSFVLAESAKPDECIIYDPANNKLLYSPIFYTGPLYSAILIDNAIVYADDDSLSLYDLDSQTSKVIYTFNSGSFVRYNCQMILEKQALYFVEPSSMTIVAYSVNDDSLTYTKASSINCAEFTIVDDRVYSVCENGQRSIIVQVSNIVTGETFSCECAPN